MNGNCHLALGIASGISAGLITSSNPEQMVLLISAAMIGSLFPDIDNPKSHVGKLTKPVSLCVGRVSAFFGCTKENHRGVFHDLGFFLVGLFLCFFYFKPLVGFFIGGVSHLILDAFNASGVPVFIVMKRFHLGKIDGNSKSAKIITLICVIIVLVIGIIVIAEGNKLDLWTENKIIPVRGLR